MGRCRIEIGRGLRGWGCMTGLWEGGRGKLLDVSRLGVVELGG